MSIEGVDFSFARPGGAALAAAGKRFVMRYLEYSHASAASSGKFLTKPEILDYRGNGLAICALFESTSIRALDGHGAGVADATDARIALEGLGTPPLPVYFAVDFDATPAQQPTIDAYLTGAGSVLGVARVGVYGSYGLVTRCRASGTATWFYQAYAWSSGKIASFAHVYQYLNGQNINGAVDLDRALKDNYGQWDAPGGAGPEEPIVRSFYLDDTKPAVSITPKANPAIRMLNIVTDTLLPVPADFGTRIGHPTVINPGIGIPVETAGYMATYHAASVFFITSNVTTAPLPGVDCTAAIAADRAKAHIVWE